MGKLNVTLDMHVKVVQHFSREILNLLIGIPHMTAQPIPDPESREEVRVVRRPIERPVRPLHLDSHRLSPFLECVPRKVGHGAPLIP